MSIDRKLCGKLLEQDDLQEVISSDLEVSDLKGDGRDAYEFIMNYHRSYDEFPDPQTIEDKIGVEVLQTDDAFEYLVDQVKQRKARNIGVRGADQILEKAKDEDISGMKQAFKQSLSRLHEQEVEEGGRVQDFGDFVDERIEYYKYLKTKEGPEGIKMPWETANYKTDAWRDGNTHLIIGRTGIGKTWTWLKCSLEAYYNDKKVLVITTEMTRNEIGRRVDAMHAQVPYNKLKEGELNFEQEKKLRDKMGDFMDNPGYVLVPNGFADSTMDIDMLIAEHEPDIVFIDGIYLIEPTVDYSGMTEKLNKTSSQIKLTALRQNIPVVSTHQANRDGAGTSNLSLTNVAYSDKLGWDSSIVLAVYGDDDMIDRGERELSIIKARDGEEGSFMINFDFQDMDFEEIDNEVEIEDDRSGEEPDEENHVGGEVGYDYEVEDF